VVVCIAGDRRAGRLQDPCRCSATLLQGQGWTVVLMAHQPPFNELPDELDQLALDPKVRELSILRVLHRAHAHQACVERIAGARRVGVSDEQIIAIQHPSTGPFSPKEWLGLAFVDEVIRTPRISDGLFEPMRSMFSEREIMELVLLVARYATPGQQLAA